jgi:hypothetical protein
MNTRRRRRKNRRTLNLLSVGIFIDLLTCALALNCLLIDGSIFMLLGCLVSCLPVYIFISPLFGLSIIQYGVVFIIIALAGGFFLMKANLAVSIKTEKDLLEKRFVLFYLIFA